MIDLSGKERCEEFAHYVLDNKATVRQAAHHFGISKSTVHKDLSARLKYVNRSLYNEVKKILDLNKSERHIRGGEATKRKYEERKSKVK
jgi:putative DeoR family transcriptional regulator (stage III sporulation protein D)